MKPEHESQAPTKPPPAWEEEVPTAPYRSGKFPCALEEFVEPSPRDSRRDAAPLTPAQE